MNDTLQAIIVILIIVLAGILYYRSRRKQSNEDCSNCPLKDSCKKKK